MTDSEYIEKLFYKDSAYKKRIARGSANKVRLRNGMKTSLDYMTAKERKAMNGEVVSINMNEPLTYEELTAVSVEMQKEYIGGLIEKYGVSYDEIEKMLGITSRQFAQWRQNVGFRGKVGRRKFDADGWRVFRYGTDVLKLNRLGQPDEQAPSVDNMDLIMQLLKTAKHAKITIELEV